MDGARLTRLRWRLRGASLWPTFVVLVGVDAVLGHLLPPAGDGQSLGSALVVGMFAMLLGVIVLAPALGLALRRLGSDMPRVVARDYAGTVVVLAVSSLLLVLGLVHRGEIGADRAAADNATARAEAWIRAKAPGQYRHELAAGVTYAIEPGSVYRTCVPDRGRERTYCVVVNLGVPFPGGVTFSGYEPNSVLAAGTG